MLGIEGFAQALVTDLKILFSALSRSAASSVACATSPARMAVAVCASG
jgi:hypothetical protein